VRPNLCKLAQHGPWLVWKRFIRLCMRRQVKTWLSTLIIRIYNSNTDSCDRDCRLGQSLAYELITSTVVQMSVTRKARTITHPFNGPLSGITRVSRYQKGKNNLDFTEARDSEWQWHQLGHMQVCTSLQTDDHASTPPLSFYRQDALPSTQPTASKHWRDQSQNHKDHINSKVTNTLCC